MATRNTAGRRLLSEAKLEFANPFDQTDYNNIVETFNAPTVVAPQVVQPTTTAAVPSIEEILAQGGGSPVVIDGVMYQPIFESSGQGETFEQGPLTQVVAYKPGETATGQSYKTYSPSMEEIGTNKFQKVGNIGTMLQTAAEDLAPLAAMALTAGGAGGALGGFLTGGGLTGTAASALGNALISGGAGALTGQDPLKAALLAAGGTYAGGLFGGADAGIGGAEGAEFADMAAGLSPEFGTTAAYDAAIAAGAPTALSSAPLTTSFASPLEELTSGGLVTETGAPALLSEEAISALPTVSETAPVLAEVPTTPDAQRIEVTGAKARQTIGDVAAEVNAGELFGPTMTGAQTAKYDEVLEKTGSKEEADKAASAVGQLTLKDLYTALQALGALSSTGLFGGGGGGGQQRPFVPPTATVPTGNEDYYNAVQQYYNTYMPTAPRDVSTPLQQWYQGKFGG